MEVIFVALLALSYVSSTFAQTCANTSPTAPFTIPSTGSLCSGSVTGPATRCLANKANAKLYPVSQTEVLTAHNCQRNIVNPPAVSPLPSMIWDDDLAKLAERWAAQCSVASDAASARSLPGRMGMNLISWTNVGQNTYGTSLNRSFSDVINNAWAAEKKYFYMGMGSWTGYDVVTHYTQIVYSKTVAVGCGRAYCTGSVTPYYYVCNYGPAGNLNGADKIPYTAAATTAKTTTKTTTRTTTRTTTKPTTTTKKITTTTKPLVLKACPASPAPASGSYQCSSLTGWPDSRGVFTKSVDYCCSDNSAIYGTIKCSNLDGIWSNTTFKCGTKTITISGSNKYGLNQIGCNVDSDCEQGKHLYCQSIVGTNMNGCSCMDGYMIVNIAAPGHVAGYNWCMKKVTCQSSNDCGDKDWWCCPYQHICLPSANALCDSPGCGGATTPGNPAMSYMCPEVTASAPFSVPKRGSQCSVTVTGPATRCLGDVATALYGVSQTEVLAVHNCHRGKVVPAAKVALPNLQWDDELAIIAERWAAQCPNGHDSYAARALGSRNSNGVSWSVVGQNICYASYNQTWSSCINAWADERADFTFGVGAAAGKVTGHYTQVVAERSTYVGCGHAYCPSLSMPYIQVCNYAPGGNYNGGEITPYVKA